jgi:dihydrofolate synthase / folylpolyglutamate synthase
MVVTEYERTLTWLYTLEAARGMDFKLERVALALQRLGDPQRSFRSLHIAGTNGKGSVAAMLHAMLSADGYRVGLYVSPHLVRFGERIRVGHDEIGEADVVALTREIQKTVTSGGIDLTFFEFVTVMALLHFARAGVEVAVIEVGLGGRLDATNVIDPEVSVITTIGRDHVQYLGRSISSVAAEKAGIVKPSRPVVLGRLRTRARAVVCRIAAEHHAPIVEPGRDYMMTMAAEPTFEGLGWTLSRLSLSLRGAFQRENAGTALATLAVVRERIPVTEKGVRTGLASVRWPGRFDIVQNEPLAILDGAHNADGVSAMVREIGLLGGGRKLHVLFAVMRDKDWRSMVKVLGPACASATVTEVFPRRGLKAERPAQLFSRYCPTTCEADPISAWERLRVHAAPGDVVLATGSLFLIGALYPAREAAERTRVAGSQP